MKYFTFSEFSESEKARRLGIDNKIPERVEAHVVELVDLILDPLREAWGGPLTISSGYRCPELNKAVNGSATSAHMDGWAADIVPDKNDKRGVDGLISFAAKWLNETGVAFDQCIDEKEGDKKWLHIGIRNRKGEQRREIKKIKV